MIQFQNLTKKFGDLTAVDSIDIAIPSGTVFGFLGPNGAGKTTSIKMTVGLMKPTEGRILIDGTDVQEKPEETKQKIGYIPDSPYIYDKLTAWEFVSLVGGLFGMDEKDIIERSEYYFDLFGVGDWANDRAEEYSHGMRQKIVLSASLMHEPSIIVIDEPMVGLDPQSQKTVKDVLRKKAEEGATVFMSTHTLSIAEEICDRVGIITHGKILMIETIEEIRKRFKDEKEATGKGDLEELFIKLTSGKGE
ncbi:MAG: ABC transporter ATP-binding protein [Candidatus Zixiibacteriota bacterium]